MQELIDKSKLERQQGLIEETHDSILYIDEVNLFDDHIVNILLDVTSTGKLIIQREGTHDSLNIHLTLVGTIKPRRRRSTSPTARSFWLDGTDWKSLTDRKQRRAILKTVLDFDQALLQEHKVKFCLFRTRT